ncbi:MAG: NAD(P)H-dependent oxidoreductase [Clostridium sp.]|nr:NAD(P)H-dependent oxidoreductase [Clostridium sp.]
MEQEERETGTEKTDGEILLIRPREPGGRENSRLLKALRQGLAGVRVQEVTEVSQLEAMTDESGRLAPEGWTGKHLALFAIDLGEYGVNLEYTRLLGWLRSHPKSLEGWTGGVTADADSDLYTKSAARELVFTANCAGCAYVGRPLVEGTKTLSNFAIVASNLGTDLYGAYVESIKLLVKEMARSQEPDKERKRELLVLHASSHKSSNTYAVWQGVKQYLTDISITEIGLRNGTLADCSGCPYKMCLHFGERGSCFYGGVMVENVYPAVKKADGILLLAPNYNDALSANLTAFINRLTALFRTTRFYDKKLFGIVVSGYSGSDLIAEQMIAALNMNKTFYLPGHFAMLETANHPGEAMKLPGIEERMRQYAKRIQNNL